MNPRPFFLAAVLLLVPAWTAASTALAQDSSHLGVVGVLPDDVLFVRSAPGASSAITGALTYDATGVQPTGKQKLVGKASWIEIRHGSTRGWVSQSYLAAVTPSRNVTSDWAKSVKGTPGPEALAKHFVEVAMSKVGATGGGSDEEGSVDVRFVGLTSVGPRRAVVLVSGYMDDSVRGEQLVLTMKQEGAIWLMDTVRSSTLCWRGVSGDLCL